MPSTHDSFFDPFLSAMSDGDHDAHAAARRAILRRRLWDDEDPLACIPVSRILPHMELLDIPQQWQTPRHTKAEENEDEDLLEVAFVQHEREEALRHTLEERGLIDAHDNTASPVAAPSRMAAAAAGFRHASSQHMDAVHEPSPAEEQAAEAAAIAEAVAAAAATAAAAQVAAAKAAAAEAEVATAAAAGAAADAVAAEAVAEEAATAAAELAASEAVQGVPGPDGYISGVGVKPAALTTAYAQLRDVSMLESLYDRGQSWSLGAGANGAVTTVRKRATGEAYALKTMPPPTDQATGEALEVEEALG